MEERYSRDEPFANIRIDVRDESGVAKTESDVVGRIRSLRHDQRLLYTTVDKDAFTRNVNGVFAAVTTVVALITAVSLLLAGTGIMNIMLVSAIERTREIGLRRAIGARKSQILMQFISEALLLCGIGSFVGLIAGLSFGGAVNALLVVKLTGYMAPLFVDIFRRPGRSLYHRHRSALRHLSGVSRG